MNELSFLVLVLASLRSPVEVRSRGIDWFTRVSCHSNRLREASQWLR
jgi:hypothetical protein